MNKSTSISNLFEALTENLSPAELKAATVISDISSRIAIERCKKGMTQKQFADLMGVTQGMVSKWESGDYNFTVESICNIFCELDLDFNFEIFEDEIKTIIDFKQDIHIKIDSKNKNFNKNNKDLLLIAG